MAFALSATLAGPLPFAVPPLLAVLAGLIRPFPRPDARLLLAAALCGVAWSAAYGTAVQSGPTDDVPIGATVQLEGWLEVELDGGALLHVEGDVVPLLTRRSMREGAGVGPRELGLRSGRAVRVRGRVVEPWHPKARRLVRVEALELWEASGVAAPGTPPLVRGWMRFRLRTRAGLRERIAVLFPDHAGLVAALLLADRSALPPETRDAFTRAGTAHLLAISGFHVGVLAGWVLIALSLLRVPRRVRPGTAAVVVWVYVATLGFPTSAVRAALLVSAASVGRLRARPVHPLGAWGLALAVVVLADPSALRGPGAQLSFAGSLGLIAWSRRWGEGIGGPRPSAMSGRRARLRHAAGLAIAASAAAQIATLPFVAWHFQRIPMVGLPASVLATPPVAAALPGVLLALLLDVFVSPAASVVAGGVSGLLSVTQRGVEWFAQVGGEIWLGPPHVAAAILGALLGTLLWKPILGGRAPGQRAHSLARRSRERRTRRLKAALLGGWIGVGLAPVALGVAGVSGGVEIHLLDVGQGDAIAVRSPRGAWLLVDAGPGPADPVLRQLARRGVSRLESLVLTHPDLDHVGGAAGVVDALRIGRIVTPALLRGTQALQHLGLAAGAADVPWTVVRGGDAWEMDGVEFRVLHAGGQSEAPNDHSIVLHLRYGDFDALLTGDVTSAVEDMLPGRLPPDTRIEVLKLAHHGSTTSTSAAFLDDLEPATAVVSVGLRNRFGHPARQVLHRLDTRGIPLIRTDRGGAVRIRGRRDGSYGITSEFDGSED